MIALRICLNVVIELAILLCEIIMSNIFYFYEQK